MRNDDDNKSTMTRSAQARTDSPRVASPPWRSKVTGLVGAISGRFLRDWRPEDPELGRRASLITKFGFLGFLFGMAYAVFYWLIGHRFGSAIIIVCSIGFGATPFFLRVTRAVGFFGNLLAGIMAGGFTALCGVEGGMSGHAIAWLVSVPLCGLLLAGKRAGLGWMGVSFLAALAVVVGDLLGVPMTARYDARWHSLVTASGYLGLVAFMSLLGMIFEDSRERAFGKMQSALGLLESSNRQLAHLNQEKNEFLGIAAHDLKNPLTAIIGNAELIGMMEDREKVVRLANGIHLAGTRMNALINDLLDANAIEEGRFTSDIGPCEIDALVHETVGRNLVNAQRKQITVRVIVTDGLWVKADRNATLQILDNLLSNAIKYSPPGGAVEVRTTACEGLVLTSIRDTGPGLSRDDQTKLFRKFTKLSPRPTGGESSTGLGLSIVKRLAEAMSGSVECASLLGNGSTFTLKLPATERATSATAHQTTLAQLAAVSF